MASSFILLFIPVTQGSSWHCPLFPLFHTESITESRWLYWIGLPTPLTPAISIFCLMTARALSRPPCLYSVILPVRSPLQQTLSITLEIKWFTMTLWRIFHMAFVMLSSVLHPHGILYFSFIAPVTFMINHCINDLFDVSLHLSSDPALF